ncbi:hypothetical protein IJU97_03460 [bacterium]|nr:hypothetical protein [bacterium]
MKLTVENDNVIEVEFIPNSKDISVVHKEAIKTADTENLLVDTYFTPTVLADIRNS